MTVGPAAAAGEPAWTAGARPGECRTAAPARRTRQTTQLVTRWQRDHTSVTMPGQSTSATCRTVWCGADRRSSGAIGDRRELFPIEAVQSLHAFFRPADDAELADRMGRIVASTAAFGANQNVDTVPTGALRIPQSDFSPAVAVIGDVDGYVAALPDSPSAPEVVPVAPVDRRTDPGGWSGHQIRHAVLHLPRSAGCRRRGPQEPHRLVSAPAAVLQYWATGSPATPKFGDPAASPPALRYRRHRRAVADDPDAPHRRAGAVDLSRAINSK